MVTERAGTGVDIDISNLPRSHAADCSCEGLSAPRRILIFLDRDEERAEIALAKTFVALALNEFEEDRTDQICGEDLEQNLSHLPLLLSYRDRALPVYEDAVTLEPCEVLAVARHALVDTLVVSGRWRRHESKPVRTQRFDRGEDVAAAAGDMLDAFAFVAMQVFLDLTVLVGRFVDRNADFAIGLVSARENSPVYSPLMSK